MAGGLNPALAFLVEMLIGVDPYVQNVIKGVIILLAIYIGRTRG
jgi:ribose/xylose/arabinose/galactoside ABC-type transport system permease subunit